MDALSEVLLKGGPVALIIAVAIALKYGIEGWTAYRRGSTGSEPQPTDAATTNAMLLDSLRMERAENARKDDRIDELETEVDDLRTQLYAQQRTYEHEIGELRSKLQDITLQLEALQQRITASVSDVPPPSH